MSAAEAATAPSACHVTTAHPATDSRIFWRECVGLAAQGFRVTLIARADGDLVSHGVRIRALRSYRSRILRMTVGVGRAAVAALRTRADVYHFHDPELLPVLVLLRLLRRRVVYDAHEWLSRQIAAKDYLPAGLRRVAQAAARVGEWLVGRVASRVVTVNAACAGVYPAGRVSIVANYPDHRDAFANVGTDVEAGASGPARFVYVGGISRVRGIEQLVDAMEVLSATDPVRLTLAGAFSSDALLDSVSARPGWRHVDYAGVLPHDQVAQQIAGAVAGMATLLQTPNHLISTPMKVFEYLAAGLPVILSDFPGWRDLLADLDCAVFVDPSDPAAIAAAMRALLRDPGRAAEMGRVGRRAVEDRFNWETQLDSLLDAYRRIGVPGTAAAPR